MQSVSVSVPVSTRGTIKCLWLLNLLLYLLTTHTDSDAPPCMAPERQWVPRGSKPLMGTFYMLFPHSGLLEQVVWSSWCCWCRSSLILGLSRRCRQLCCLWLPPAHLQGSYTPIHLPHLFSPWMFWWNLCFFSDTTSKNRPFPVTALEVWQVWRYDFSPGKHIMSPPTLKI